MCKVKITTPPSSLSTVLSNKTNLQNVRRPIIARLMSMTQNPSKHNVVVFIFCFVWLISDVMFSCLTYLTKHLVCLPLCLWYYGNRWTLHFNKVFQFQWNWFYSAYYFDCIFFLLFHRSQTQHGLYQNLHHDLDTVELVDTRFIDII